MIFRFEDLESEGMTDALDLLSELSRLCSCRITDGAMNGSLLTSSVSVPL